MQPTMLKKPRLSRAEFNRRADEYLKRIQHELLPDHATDFVAINMETNEYVLGQSLHEVFAAYRARWSDCLMYLCRVDGSPAIKFRGK